MYIGSRDVSFVLTDGQAMQGICEKRTQRESQFLRHHSGTGTFTDNPNFLKSKCGDSGGYSPTFHRTGPGLISR